MAVRTAEAEWKGDLRQGTGTFRTESGALEGRYSFGSRFEEVSARAAKKARECGSRR